MGGGAGGREPLERSQGLTEPEDKASTHSSGAIRLHTSESAPSIWATWWADTMAQTEARPRSASQSHDSYQLLVTPATFSS